MGNAGVWSNDPGDIPGDDFSLLTKFRLMSRVGSRGRHPKIRPNIYIVILQFTCQFLPKKGTPKST